MAESAVAAAAPRVDLAVFSQESGVDPSADNFSDKGRTLRHDDFHRGGLETSEVVVPLLANWDISQLTFVGVAERVRCAIRSQAESVVVFLTLAAVHLGHLEAIVREVGNESWLGQGFLA